MTRMLRKLSWIYFLVFYSFICFACEITTINVVDSKNQQNATSMFEISSDCTEQNILDYYQKLSPDYQKRFKSTLVESFNSSHLSTVIKTKQDFLNKFLPDLFSNKIDKINTSVVALGVSAPIKDPEIFEQVFGFHYQGTLNNCDLGKS